MKSRRRTPFIESPRLKGHIPKACKFPNIKIRNEIWASRDLEIFSNSEYAHAAPPIALDLFRGKGSGDCQCETVVYDFRDLNALPEFDRRQ